MDSGYPSPILFMRKVFKNKELVADLRAKLFIMQYLLVSY